MTRSDRDFDCFCLLESTTRSTGSTTTSSPGGSRGTSSRTGTGSMAETSAESAAWTWSRSKVLTSTDTLPRSCSEVIHHGLVVVDRLLIVCLADNITAMWTSGRKCNFLNKGCDSAELQPVNVNGWFWADGNKRIPSTTVPSKLTFWSSTGETGRRQPDNYQGQKEGGLENVRVSPQSSLTKVTN